MYGYIYKITCTEGSFSGRFYIGQRKWSGDIDKDKYKGSGKIIKDYYKKYPKGYVKEILAVAESREELDRLEKDYIAPCLNSDECLNVREGGNRNYDYKASEESKAKLSAALKGRRAWNKGLKIGYSPRKGAHLSDETKKKISLAKMGCPSPRKNVKLSNETKAKLSASHKGKTYSTLGKPASPLKKEHLDKIRTQYAVLQIDKETKQVLAEYSSSREASRNVGICSSCILRCCQKKPHFLTAGGYLWEFKDKQKSA